MGEKQAGKTIGESGIESRNLMRYTDLTAVLGMLRSKELTLLDPGSWDDRNDAGFMEEYKRRRKLATLLAVCFTTARERIHHWQVFGKGPSGICVEFYGRELIACMDSYQGIRHGGVRYARLQDTAAGVTVEEMPFCKRIGYRDEAEYRFIYEAGGEPLKSLSFPFELDCIHSIHLSPWLHPSLDGGVREAIRAVDGCSKLKVTRSGLVHNPQWTKALLSQDGAEG